MLRSIIIRDYVSYQALKNVKSLILQFVLTFTLIEYLSEKSEFVGFRVSGIMS